MDEPPLSPINLAEQSPRALERAMKRQAIVEQALALYADDRRPPRTALARLAAMHDLSVGTLYLWLTKYRRAQFPGLLDRHGRTKGSFRALPPAVQDFIKEHYLSPQRPSPTTVYRRTVELCAHLRIPAPSQTTVNRFLRMLPPTTIALARVGDKAWRAAFEPKCHRDYSNLAVGEWWVADHREFDVFVEVGDPSTRREPLGRATGSGRQIARPWLTAWLDLRSRTCVGWQVSLGPNSETIALALRAGILRFGLPRHLYRDNGKDFTCHYWGGKTRRTAHVRLADQILSLLQPGVLSPLGIQTHEATPYTPWAKPIESWFGHTFPEWERTLPGWCGRDNKERPEKLADEIREGRLLSFDEFLGRVGERIEQYHDREHSALHATPRSLWQGVTIERPEPRTLDLLLMRHQPATVTAQGIKLLNRYYRHEALWLHVKQRVDVRYDPNDLGRLICMQEGRFLCEAINEPAMRMGATGAALKALQQQKRAAKQRALQARDDRQVLFNPDRTLAELSAHARDRKVVTLAPPDPDPEPGTASMRRLVPGFDGAAAAIGRTAVPRRADRWLAGREDQATPVASPPAAAPDDDDERNAIMQEILDAGPRGHRSQADSERDAIMREVLHS